MKETESPASGIFGAEPHAPVPRGSTRHENGGRQALAAQCKGRKGLRPSKARIFQSGREDGVALVIVLALVVLLTGVVIAYFSRSLWDRQLSDSSLQQALADELARSALDIVTSDLKQEIVNGSTATTVANTTLYTAINSAAMVPVKNTPTIPCPTLLRISGTTPITSPGVDHPASAADSSVASANGRKITPARWNKHYLLPLADPAKPTDTTPVSSGAAAFTAPGWVYVTGAGPVTLTKPEKSVIGRYAYAIYDEGALLDVNVAGYPSAIPYVSGATMPPEYSPKGSLAFADLTQLKDASGNSWITGAGINNLVGWRNYASLRNATAQAEPSGSFPAFTFTGTTIPTPYKDMITSNTDGFLKVSGTVDASGQTDQVFLSRQDLISFCLAAGTANFNPNTLQYLGTFSRAANAPSWKPSTPTGSTIDYAATAENATSPNRNLANVRVQTPFTRPDESAASVGEPLLKTRFPLSRLALVTDTATAAVGSNIEKYFGLTRPTADGTPWTYRNGATSILTLDQVAQAGREPDFFELLKAAILSGSLGKYSNTDYQLVCKSFDQNKDAQIIQIGANLIDQYDSDNYPTAVRFFSFNPVYGVENLPYTDHVYTTIFRPNRGDPNYPKLEGWIQFGLWNPHANASDSSFPTKFRVAGTDGSIYLETNIGSSAKQSIAGKFLEFTAQGAAFAEPRLLVPNASMTGGINITGAAIDSASSPDFYFGTGSQPSNATPTAVTTTSPCHLVGFYLGSFTRKDRTITGVAADPVSLSYYHARSAPGASAKYATFELQYQDSTGNWRTYESIEIRTFWLDHLWQSGFLSCTTWMNGQYGLDHWSSQGRGPEAGAGVAYGMNGLSSMDPRTKRAGMITQIALNNERVVANATIRPGKSSSNFDSEPLSNYGVPTNPPGTVLWKYSASNKFQPALLAENKSGNTSYGIDFDGIIRRGDGDEANDVSPLWQTGTQQATRPSMLNRPFRSVAEMGYAMRGDPWKSLNFFSADSADAALMDVFTIAEAPVVAGRVNLNTPYRSVLAAILGGALKADDGTSSPPTLSVSEAGKVADVILQEQAATPFQNVAELATRIGDKLADQLDNGPTGKSDGYIKIRRESAMRALADVADTRTWNLLIDVVAQTGSFAPNAPQTAAALNTSFNVQGERRYWLHVAIDRFTGENVAKQLEPVYE